MTRLDLTEPVKRSFTRLEWALILTALANLDEATVPPHLAVLIEGLTAAIQQDDTVPVGVLVRALRGQP